MCRLLVRKELRLKAAYAPARFSELFTGGAFARKVESGNSFGDAPVVKALLYALSLTLCCYASVSAAPISYIASAAGSGSVGGLQFMNKLITFVGTGDTDSVTETQPGLFENSLSLVSFVVADTAAGQFSGHFYAFVTDTGFGFGSLSTADLFDANHPNSVIFDLRKDLAPVSGNVFGAGGTFLTTAGSLTFVVGPQSSVSANLLTILEPTSCSIVFAGLAMMGLCRRRTLNI